MSSELIERINAEIARQRQTRADILDYGTPDPLLVEAATTIAALQAELAEARKQALTQAHRIAMAAQYSKTPATDTMRGIERLLQDGPYPAGNCPP